MALCSALPRPSQSLGLPHSRAMASSETPKCKRCAGSEGERCAMASSKDDNASLMTGAVSLYADRVADEMGADEDEDEDEDQA